MITYEQAKKYVRNGWSIFPVIISNKDGKYEKRPAISWRDFQNRLPTDAELHSWFDIERYNGIGLVTGRISSVVVVDVDDSKKPAGLYSPLVSRTISGGRHYFFRWDEAIRNTVRINDSPIDFRGDGGYVVLPPSAFGKNIYTWEKETEPMYLSPLPETIKKYLQKKEIKKTITHRGYSLTGLPTASMMNHNRNDTAAHVVGKIIRAVLPRYHDSIGLLAFRDWNQTHITDQPLDENELMTTWNSILGKYRREEKNDKTVLSIMTSQEAQNKYKNLMEKYGGGLTTGFSLLDEYFKFIPQQLYLISAATHQGKTTLGLNIAVRIAQSGEPILFASLEQGVFIVPRILSMNNNLYPDNFYLLDTDQSVVISSLVEKIESMNVKPKLVVIDHLHFIKKSGDKTTDAIDNMMAEVQNMAKRLEIPILVIAHVRKLNSDRTPEMDDLRDSSSLSQIPSVVLLLHRKRNDEAFQNISYLSPYGALFIAKNRIQGRTGVISFSLEKTGNFILVGGDKK